MPASHSCFQQLSLVSVNFTAERRREADSHLYSGWAALIFVVTGSTQNSDQLVGIGGLYMAILWPFAFLDAYFGAREINSGVDQIITENPRVAEVLNLLTWGFGYFYLAERTKGMILFFAGQVDSRPLNVVPAEVTYRGCRRSRPRSQPNLLDVAERPQ